MINQTDKSIFYIRNWLYFSAFMVFCMAIIGAITRLTESGLSITEWKPITGAIPPLNEAAWMHEFNLYRNTPEYQEINKGMSLDEFKSIYFWEWFHRLWGRLIGLVYALPLIYFWVKGLIPQNYKKPFIFLLCLGGLQAVMGWVMVLSGLSDATTVSHYRLAAHLSLALIIFSYMIWLALSLIPPQSKLQTSFCKRRHGWLSLGFLFITIIWGAFMAGKDAGLISSSWPHMYEGVMIPSELLITNIQSFFENEEIIHFTHRWIAFVTLIIISLFAWRARSFPLGFMIFIQFSLGIATVMSHVAISFATLHQGGAFILTALLLREIYLLRV